jgi:DNA polymerase III gamma/tau subunit
MGMAPMSGKVRIWLIDEAHKLTGDAQNALLKMFEDTPSHVYFILATTDPHKLLRTIRTRATEIALKDVRAKDMEKLVRKVYEQETGADLDDEVCDRIVDRACGSPRKALVLLNQVLAKDDADAALDALNAIESEVDAIELARELLSPKSTWAKLAKIMNNIEGIEQQAEGIRRMVLAYMSSVALGNGKMSSRAVAIIDCFQDPYYDTGKRVWFCRVGMRRIQIEF